MAVVAWHIDPNHTPVLLLLADMAVFMFFVLSGYVLTRGWDRRFWVFLVRRFLRLWPVYALCLGVGYLIIGQEPVWTEFFWFPLLGPDNHINPPIWSLFLEAWAMPFMPVIVWAGTGGAGRALLCLAAIVIIGLFVPVVFVGAPFLAGAVLSRYDFSSALLEGPVPQALGRISYSLYLSHWLVFVLARDMLGAWGGVVALPVIFAVATAVWWCVEMPSIRVSRWAGRAFNKNYRQALQRRASF